MAGIMSNFRQLLIFLPVFLTFVLGNQAFANDEDCNSNRGGFAFPLPLDRIEGYSDPLAHKTAIIGGSDEREQVNPRKSELNEKYHDLGNALDAVVHFRYEHGGKSYPMGTGVLTGPKKDTVVASAHQFYYHKNGVAGSRIPTSSITAVIVGCPNASYTISAEDIPQYKSTAEYDSTDVSFVRLSASGCSSVKPLLITKTDNRHVDYLSRVENSVVVAGAYSPALIKSQREGEIRGSAEGPEAHSNRPDSNDVVTYYSICRLDGSRAIGSSNGVKSIYKHLCDTGPGGSGGPMLAHFPSAGWRIIGVHQGSDPSAANVMFNEAVPTNDRIFERAEKFLSAPRGNPRDI